MDIICPFYQNKYQSGWAICIQFSALFLSGCCNTLQPQISWVQQSAAAARLDIYNCNWDPPSPLLSSSSSWNMKIYSGLETPGRRDSLVSLAANMAWAGSVLAILMGQTQPKLASVSRNAHPALPALWPNILLAVKITPKPLRLPDDNHSGSGCVTHDWYYYSSSSQFCLFHFRQYFCC